MKHGNRGRRWAAAIGAVAVVLGLAAFVRSGAGTGPAPTKMPDKQVMDAIVASGKRLPESPYSWVWGTIWRDCQFVFIKTHYTSYSKGGQEVGVMDTTKAELDAQLPAVRPNAACTANTQPTAAQIAAKEAKLQELSNATRPKGAPPAPPPVLNH